MNPIFWFAAASVMQQTYINQSIAASINKEHAREAAEAELFAQKKRWFAMAKEESNQVFQENQARPLRSFVQVWILLNDFVGYEITPDIFDDMKEKEDVALLWRKLTNIYSGLERQLTDDDKEICQKAMKAIYTRRLISYAEPRLSAYDYWQLLRQS